MEFFRNLLSSSGFMPHGYCYMWRPEPVWPHVMSHTLIVVAYFSIPFTLIYFVRKRRDMPINWMFVCFALFIFACGASSGPTVTGVSPNTGPAAGGTAVTISGSNFRNGATVLFGGSKASNVAVVNSGSITARTPGGAAGSKVNVTINNTDGTTHTLANAYAYTTATASPMVTGVSPNTGPAAGGTAVTISGSNFRNGATVLFGGSKASNVAVVNSGSITARTPGGAAGSKVNVTINNTDGTTHTLANAYAYTTATASPMVTGVSPNTGPAAGGTAVTISGSNFRNGATVLFGGSKASNVAVVNSGSITARTPGGAAGSKVNVTINNTDGTTHTLANAYAYTTAPASPMVTGVSPNTGPAAGGTAVTISGSNFRNGATVLFGGSKASNVAVVNSGSITARTPGGAAGSKVNVTINNTDGTTHTLANAYAYTTATASPMVTGVSPNTGPAAGGTAVTISGSN